ncbi:MAG: ACP S-malonyltransferase [Betaproteobacteria bacterium]|nr:ACP S-malonyltransferase [Betaproteobacteria bacterium]
MMTFAFVFPGQGSQSVGMMQAYGDLPEIRSTFDEASTILGQDLWVLVTQGSEEDLALTVNTQPAMLVAGVAVYRTWLAGGGKRPQCVAGHSLGEFTALVAAGSLCFPDAVRLTRFRAEAMQKAVPQGLGGMAAILGLADEDVREACREAAGAEVLEPANFNSPGQVVIAGHRSAIERGVEAAKARGAKRALPLAMSVPSHCSLMRPAADQLQQYLAEIQLLAPSIPVIHNATVVEGHTPDEIRAALVQQLYSPVRWVETIRAMGSRGITQIFECGPGKVLAPLVKRIQPDIQGLALNDAAALIAARDILA